MNEENNVLLYDAACNGDYQEVKHLIQSKNCNVNFQNEQAGGKTPLYIAASWGSSKHLDVIQFLLDHGADVNSRNNASQTPLHTAASWGHVDVVKQLISSNADLNAINNEGNTALHMPFPESIFVNIIDAYELKGLMTMMETAINNMESLKRYLKYLPNFDNDYMTIYNDKVAFKFRDGAYDAIFYNHFGVVAALVEAGANINVQNNNGMRPLSRAMYSGHGAIIQFLMDNGALL